MKEIQLPAFLLNSIYLVKNVENVRAFRENVSTVDVQVGAEVAVFRLFGEFVLLCIYATFLLFGVSFHTPVLDECIQES